MQGNLGGKFGAEVVSVLETDKISDILSIPLSTLRNKLGQEQGMYVYNLARGIDYSEIVTRTQIKSMARYPLHLQFETDNR